MIYEISKSFRTKRTIMSFVSVHSQFYYLVIGSEIIRRSIIEISTKQQNVRFLLPQANMTIDGLGY